VTATSTDLDEVIRELLPAIVRSRRADGSW
jgi:hypothetical protein